MNEQDKVYTLKKPIVFDGRQIDTLTLDFDKLKSKDVLQAERRFVAETGGQALSKELNKAYQAYIVAAAADVPIELIHELYAKDFTSVTMEAQGFLLL
ncbi:phage tail assembly protein [Paenibacillus xanthanilyticus]|uniref:Phage tail assembly protein n=1 Tax=Paenibacillus xanthanilyticus TaxID=1783531 RepID=A0ABV8KA80_9BACL